MMQFLLFINLAMEETPIDQIYSLIFEENKGTCSTKHATLAALALENNIFDIKFQTAVCKFDKFFDKKISKFLLDPLNVLYFPEMHCF